MVLGIVALLVLAGCGSKGMAQQAEERISQEEFHALAPGCHLMKSLVTKEMQCFDCVEGVCKGAKKDEWVIKDAEEMAAQGYACEVVNGVCALKQ